MTKGPRCRLCEHEHWSYQPHVFTDVKAEPIVTPSVTKRAAAVTKTPTVTKGRPKQYASTAARMAAYRARKKAHA
jgi:hypothetical protein